MAKIQESKMILPDEKNPIDKKTIKLPQLKELFKDVDIPLKITLFQYTAIALLEQMLQTTEPPLLPLVEETTTLFKQAFH